VRDENGDPVRHAQVTLYMEDHRGGMNRVSRLLTSTSDDVGYFDFSSLIPGTYFVSVSATPWYAVHAPSAAAGTGAGYSGYRRRWMQPIRTPITAARRKRRARRRLR